jgi:autoinducer 2-degrading protein
MRIISVVFTARHDTIDEFRAVLLAHARASVEEESGCRQFDVASDPADPARFFIYEVYDDEAAIAAHQATEHFKRNAPRLRELSLSRERSDYTMLPGTKPKR